MSVAKWWWVSYFKLNKKPPEVKLQGAFLWGVP